MKAKQIGHSLRIPDRSISQADGANSTISKTTTAASLQSKNIILFSKNEKQSTDSSPIK